MKLKTSIITLILTLLFASNAFAVGSLSITTGFEEDGWDTNLYGEGWALGMNFIGNWTAGDGGAGPNNDGSVIGSTYSRLDTGVNGGLGIQFVNPSSEGLRPAESFLFTYKEQANPIYLTIDMSSDLGFIGDTDPAQYYRVTGTGGSLPGYSFLGIQGDSLLFELTGTTKTYPGGFIDPSDPSFSFYMNDGSENLLTIDALFFSAYNPFDSGDALVSDGTPVVELTAFDYTPTPIPGAAWLLGSGLVGLVGLRRRFRG